MTLARTVLGDIPADALGICYAHEHLVIDGGVPGIINPEIALTDVESAVTETRTCSAAGVRSMVDAMPADAGRNVVKLADISRRTGVHIIVATGLHHARYYGSRHWSELLEASELADLFIADIEVGVDEFDYNGPVVRRTRHRAGIVKVAGSDGGPSARDRPTFEAAALTAARTGVPVLTHCEGGTGGMEQIKLLDELNVPLRRVVLSPYRQGADRGYHRDLLGLGCLRRLRPGIALRADCTPGHADGRTASPAQVLLGTDGARRSCGNAWRLPDWRPCARTSAYALPLPSATSRSAVLD